MTDSQAHIGSIVTVGLRPIATVTDLSLTFKPKVFEMSSLLPRTGRLGCVACGCAAGRGVVGLEVQVQCTAVPVGCAAAVGISASATSECEMAESGDLLVM